MTIYNSSFKNRLAQRNKMFKIDRQRNKFSNLNLNSRLASIPIHLHTKQKCQPCTIMYVFILLDNRSMHCFMRQLCTNVNELKTYFCYLKSLFVVLKKDHSSYLYNRLKTFVKSKIYILQLKLKSIERFGYSNLCPTLLFRSIEMQQLQRQHLFLKKKKRTWRKGSVLQFQFITIKVASTE
jgi:hypothetical protein